jgi:hypothetical protein
MLKNVATGKSVQNNGIGRFAPFVLEIWDKKKPHTFLHGACRDTTAANAFLFNVSEGVTQFGKETPAYWAEVGQGMLSQGGWLF